jgi:hypothetical protein
MINRLQGGPEVIEGFYISVKNYKLPRKKETNFV